MLACPCMLLWRVSFTQSRNRKASSALKEEEEEEGVDHEAL